MTTPHAPGAPGLHTRADTSPEVQAIETIGGVITDLVTLAERLPVAPDQVEPAARILDSLAGADPRQRQAGLLCLGLCGRPGRSIRHSI